MNKVMIEHYKMNRTDTKSTYLTSDFSKRFNLVVSNFTANVKMLFLAENNDD